MPSTSTTDDPFELGAVLTGEEYAHRLRERAEHGRDAAGVPVLSEDEAYVVAELLGQYANSNPTAALNHLASQMASRLYSRLGI